MEVEHKLKSITRTADNCAEWVCECGQKGYSTCAPHLVDHIDVEVRARRNHELHQARAYIRMLKETPTV